MVCHFNFSSVHYQTFSCFVFHIHRHSHGRPDQCFSKIRARLAVKACLTIEKFVCEIQKSYKPMPTMTLLKRSINFHQWLEGASSKHYSCISLPRQFIFSKNENGDATTDGVRSMSMFTLQRLPTQKLRWNANCSVFSKWETSSTRTSPEKSEEILKKAEAQVFFTRMGSIMTSRLTSKGVLGSDHQEEFASGKSYKLETTKAGGQSLMGMSYHGLCPFRNNQ